MDEISEIVTFELEMSSLLEMNPFKICSMLVALSCLVTCNFRISACFREIRGT